jgi:hypothetical protein
VLIYHQAIAGKGHWAIARCLLFPLATLQLARLIKTLLRERRMNPVLPWVVGSRDYKHGTL